MARYEIRFYFLTKINIWAVVFQSAQIALNLYRGNFRWQPHIEWPTFTIFAITPDPARYMQSILRLTEEGAEFRKCPNFVGTSKVNFVLLKRRQRLKKRAPIWLNTLYPNFWRFIQIKLCFIKEVVEVQRYCAIS